ncbi:hypothetical protein FIBSPDRAFT_899947 [Athelia psychrophila]|uniref:Uncharacterized protein n=1 Tax=Athelia psychrophila TaxID=1759441 RepID=A0A165Z2Q9_9AGAM|nr:hypothetical protein FIBSPDRAFT_899947 [Fibularhizoctonia sp. CBS 109695]
MWFYSEHGTSADVTAALSGMALVWLWYSSGTALQPTVPEKFTTFEAEINGILYGIGVPTTYALLIGLGGSMGDIIAPCSPQIAAQSSEYPLDRLKVYWGVSTFNGASMEAYMIHVIHTATQIYALNYGVLQNNFQPNSWQLGSWRTLWTIIEFVREYQPSLCQIE